MSGQFFDDLTKLSGKLIRDNIPDHAHAKGETLETRPLLIGERKPYNQKKILEEVTELLCAESPRDIEEEIGDVIDALRKYASLHGLVWKKVEKARIKKRKLKGGFDKFICLISPAPQK